MEKVKEILKNLFTKSNLLVGVFSFCVGLVAHTILKYVSIYTFRDIGIFIGTSMGFMLIFFVLGYIVNKTLFKDDIE